MTGKSFAAHWEHDLARHNRTVAPAFLLGSAIGLSLYTAYDYFSTPTYWRVFAVCRLALSAVALSFAFLHRAGRLRGNLSPVVFLTLTYAFFAWGASLLTDPTALTAWNMNIAMGGCFWPPFILVWSVRRQIAVNVLFASMYVAFRAVNDAVDWPSLLVSGGLFLTFAWIVSPLITAWRFRMMQVQSRLRYDLLQKTEEAEAQRGELAFYAAHDAMTGILNRRAGLQFLDTALALANRQGQPLSLLYLDVNDLKRVNDTLGHAAGDALIQSVAGLLRMHVRASDMVCRMGGDEFLIVLQNCKEADAGRLERELARAAEAVYAHGDTPYKVSFSTGVASWEPGGAVDAAALVARADAAMFAHKRASKPPPRSARTSGTSAV